jgi:hypothetical protein
MDFKIDVIYRKTTKKEIVKSECKFGKIIIDGHNSFIVNQDRIVIIIKNKIEFQGTLDELKHHLNK